MQTVFETRRERLKQLITRFGTIAALNVALGYDATNPRLSQIQNRSIRSDRGTPYEMGDTTAREIEAKLELETGWMDTPAGVEKYAKLEVERLHQVAEQLAPYQIEQWIAIGETLARTPPMVKSESEQVRQTDGGMLKNSPHTGAADASTGKSPALVSSARVRRGGLLDPAAKKKDGAAVNEHAQDERRSRTRNAGRR